MGQGRPTSPYGRIKRRIEQEIAIDPNWQFARDVLRLIWEYRGYSLAILAVTVLQEVSALWPVSLLGQFIDRLPSGNVGNVVWLFLGASILAPGIMRGTTSCCATRCSTRPTSRSGWNRPHLANRLLQ